MKQKYQISYLLNKHCTSKIKLLVEKSLDLFSNVWSLNFKKIDWGQRVDPVKCISSSIKIKTHLKDDMLQDFHNTMKENLSFSEILVLPEK